MTLFSKSITIFALYCLCVKCDNIESNESKTGEKSVGVVEFGYKTNPHSQQSSLIPNENGYNNHQNSYDQPFVEESNNAQTDSSGDQNNGQSVKKEQKTLILAIPVKLAIQSPGQQNYESDPQQPVVQSTHSTYHSISNNNNPYNLAKYSTLSNLNSHQPSAISATSQPIDPIVDSQRTRVLSQQQQQQQQQQSFKPQSKIFTSINSKLKSATYSTAHSIPYSSYHSNGKQYKAAYNLNHDYNEDKDYKYGKNNNYRLNQRDEYKTETNRGVDDYGSNKYKDTYNRHNGDIKFDDSNEDKSIFNLKENAKPLYDSDSKFEYDYDSDTDSEHPFDEYDNTRVEDSYHNNHKTGHYSSSIINDRNNRYKGKSIAFEEKPDLINNHNYYPENGQSYGSSNNQDSIDGWLNHNYDTIKPNANNWPQIYETMVGNDFTSLSRVLNGRESHALSNKESGGNAYYTPVSELLAESNIKTASAPVAKSKIYGSPSPYQPLSLFAGFGRDYGSVNINGDLYPAALVANHPPRKLYKASFQENNKFAQFRPLMNHQFLKMPPRNPLVMRPSFTPGFRASKPLANYTPFASASTTSFLSSFPNGFAVKKSFPRHIFPALYG